VHTPGQSGPLSSVIGLCGESGGSYSLIMQADRRALRSNGVRGQQGRHWDLRRLGPRLAMVANEQRCRHVFVASLPCDGQSRSAGSRGQEATVRPTKNTFLRLLPLASLFSPLCIVLRGEPRP
jgi:hypothetical protein